PDNWTIDSVKSALAAKKLSARELATEFFTRIDEQNPTLNAYLTLSPERAYAQADKIDALIAANKPLPPLSGVPIGIHDVLSAHALGPPGTPQRRQRHPPAAHSPAVAPPEAPVSVLLANTNRDQCAIGRSNESSGVGLVKSPVAFDRVPGRSGGRSAAVAAPGD